MLSLNALWFLLIAVLFVGFVFLEGFDFGIGMSSRFVAKNDIERRAFINTIGPFWDANEVWLITAVGAMFAAFPNWYASLLSGFYLPFVFLLLALIGRGVAFEFRGKSESKAWRNTWDWIIFFGSMLPPMILGIVFAAFLKGIPLDKQMNIHLHFTDVVNVYTLLGGITLTVLCLWHGLIFATLRTVDDLRDRCRRAAKKLLPINALFLLVFILMTFFSTDVFAHHGMLLESLFILGVLVYLLAGFFLTKKRDGWSFVMSGFTLILLIASVFIGLFPNVLISSISSQYDLTIHNASSSSYSLKIITYLSLTLLPFVLGYQIWSYYVFRKRVNHKERMEY
ncbi:cytochrome d ubiquinol oxidase subunit II [Heyndrickxia acidicola]|uniref:Cytochrome d ubiquinol oxidase subunit II n=1 Tax=Heyndrickxia acidicola TaxID=209389 RepID=A0ABU6MG47_9BACI|nr:cytochrome d ubiquinol oxidase subunit II [Heyndrickxia acidicola]MED1203667.1 cytochrome d ubiquinol oxidase subunit II [Heyndrickxia acidicola]